MPIFCFLAPPTAPNDPVEIRKMLQSPSAIERRSEVRAIREREIDSLYEAVLDRGTDADPWVRWEMGATVTAFVEGRLNRLVASTKGDRTVDRQALARVVSSYDVRKAKDSFNLGVALPLVRFALDQPNDQMVTSLAKEALIKTETYGADPNFVPRTEFCGLGYAESWQGVLNYLSKHRPALVADLVRQTMSSDPHRVWVVRYLSDSCLSRIATSEWRMWLRSRSPEVRCVAAEIAGDRQDRRLWNDLVLRLDDSLVATRVHALWALLGIDRARAYVHWVRRIESSEGDELAVLLKLGRRYSLDYAPAVRRGLQTATGERRTILEEALAADVSE